MASRTRTIGPGLSPTIQLFGDWNKVSLVLHDLPNAIKAGALIGQRSAANKLRRLIKQNIRNNGVPGVFWPPLSPKYAKIKELKGYDSTNLLIMTGLYHRSIKVWRENENYYVGVKKGVRNPASGGNITVGMIANILEMGSSVRNIKPRPLWVPTFKQFKGNKRIRNIIVWNIRNQILKRYNIRAKVY